MTVKIDFLVNKVSTMRTMDRDVTVTSQVLVVMVMVVVVVELQLVELLKRIVCVRERWWWQRAVVE